MSLAIIDAREWQRVFDLKTGAKRESDHPNVEMVKGIIAGHSFPGDVQMATNAWVTDTALELIDKYQPQFAFISYGLPYFTFRFHETSADEREQVIQSVFQEIDRLVVQSGFTPVIVGSGGLVPIKGYIDLSRLDGLAIASNWTAGYAGLHNPTPKDLEYIASLPQVERMVSKNELADLFQGEEQETERLPEYFVVAKEGYTYKAPGTTLRKAVNIPAHNYFIPVATELGSVNNITEIRELIEKNLPHKKIAIIVVEGVGLEDFPLPYQRCANSLGWYCYEQGELQFFALYMGKHNFLAYPQGYPYYEDDDENKPYPLSGYFRDIPTDTIGAHMGIKRAAVGSRSMFPHTTTGADICIECFARNLFNQGIMAVITEEAMSMSEKENICKHPEKLKGKPGDCSPQQIESCHGKEAAGKCACIPVETLNECTCTTEEKVDISTCLPFEPESECTCLQTDEAAINEVNIRHIGIVHSPESDVLGMSLQGQTATIEIFPEYVGGLRRIEDHSNLWILTWFHKANREILETVPKKVNPDAPVYGVFGIRTAGRPNPFGLSLVKILKVEGNKIEVQGLDAIDGSPVVDIKPYFEQDIIFSPRAPYIRPQKKEMIYQMMYTEALRHHQEECDDFLLALRIAMMAEEEFGKLNSPDLLVKVTGSACLADTIQGLTRARVANPARFEFVQAADRQTVAWQRGSRIVTISLRNVNLTRDGIINLPDEELLEKTIVDKG